MASFPASLRLAHDAVARRDPSRLAILLAAPATVGKPVLTDPVRRRLAALSLVVEGDDEQDSRAGGLGQINHGPDLIWLRQTRDADLPGHAAVQKAVGRTLAWVAPVFRLPHVRGLDAYFCARPDAILLGGGPNEAVATDAIARKHGLVEAKERSARLPGWRYFSAGKGQAVELAATLRKANAAPAVDLEYIPLRSPFAFTPDDTYFSEQWGMARIGAPQAWDIETGDPDVIVAVIDSGCDLDHADLAPSFLNDGVNVANPILNGSPIVEAPSGRLDWHGTAVAGVIAAGLNNATGVAGLASGCRILPIAVPLGSTVEVAEAVNVAVSEGADVINMSIAIGSFWFETSLRPAIDAAIGAGRLVCAAAGNSDASPLVTPGRYGPVMGCGGSGKDDRRWRVPAVGLGSHYGDEVYLGLPTGVSVVAPAADIVSTDITGAAGFTPGVSPVADYLHRSPTIESGFSATSAATPHVSGAAALVMSHYPMLAASEVRNVIERTAEKVGGYAYADLDGYPNGSRHPEMGYGRLNAHRALDLGDVMIRDWPGDDGTEPSTPPRDNYYSASDVVIRPFDDGVFLPDSPDEASLLMRGVEHTASVRVTNVGPADARGVRVDLRATPWVGLEFVYPDDWTEDDALHIRPANVETGPFAMAAGTERIATFRFSAAQVDAMVGWTEMRWHPCLLARTTAANDYAFAAAPDGAALQMRRNNLAQRNLTVAAITERSAEFPFVIGHPATKNPDLGLMIDAGGLTRLGQVYVILADASRAFPAARKAKAFGKGTVKVGGIKGGKATRSGNRPAVRMDGRRTFIEFTRPERARYAVSLLVKFKSAPPAGKQWPVTLTQYVGGRSVGGATVVFSGG